MLPTNERDAVTAARENATLNGVSNVTFEEGEVETVLPAVAERHGAPDVVILDPPRAGLHPAARRAVRVVQTRHKGVAALQAQVSAS